MTKKMTIICLLLISAFCLPQKARLVAPLKTEPPKSEFTFLPYNAGVPVYGPEAANWVAVDTMTNTFGPAIGALNPLAVDPATGTAVIFHRGKTTYTVGSGALVYNYSTDKGATWARVLPAINSAQPTNGRYPSMAIYASTTQGTLPVFSWPELVAGAFGGVGYGADASIGAGTPIAGILTDPVVLFSSQVPTFANANVAVWASDNQSDASIKLFRTVDFQTIENFTPPNWTSSAFGDGGNVTYGGVAGLDNTLYYGVAATFTGQNPIASGWYPGYSKSTDNGLTWSSWKVADWRTIPSVSRYDRLWDYIKDDEFVAYQGDINVDKNGKVHLLFTVTDTTINNNTGFNAIIEVFETSTGWDAKVVYHGLSDNSFTRLDGPGLGQMGPNAYLALNEQRDFLVASWVNPNPAIPNDSLCDIWVSYRTLENGTWSQPQNLTGTAGMNENSSHMAPFLAFDQSTNKYSAYLMYNYPAGYTGHFPNGTSPDYTTMPSVIYIARVDFNSGQFINPTWQANIIISDGGGDNRTITMGQHPTATNGIDQALGEEELPPVPPTGVMDARFILPVTPSIASLMDFRGESNNTVTWTFNFQPGTGYPVNLNWNPNILPSGTFRLRDVITGTIINVDMKAQSSYQVSNTGITSLKVEYSKEITANVDFVSGWNMISVPLKSADMFRGSLFPTSNSLAYGFSNGYYTADSLKNKSGYWLRFPATGNVNITGSKINDSIQVLAGWNMIGVNDLGSPVSGITTIPSGIITSNFYGFSNGYQSATTLEKGKGYWVRVSQNGILRLNNNTPTKAEGSINVMAEIPRGWGKLTLTDASGSSGLLYTAVNITDKTRYELPPVPPAGIFDLRYESGTQAEEIISGQKMMIRLSSAEYPVRIKSDGFSGVLKDGMTGTIVNRTIMNGEEITINAPGVEIFTIEGTEEQPLKYELTQNYPNPFNPSTTIGYSISEKNNVSLVIYNQAGETIDVLVSEVQEAGRYNLVWNADKFSSGVYFCELKAGSFKSIKKLMLIK